MRQHRSWEMNYKPDILLIPSRLAPIAKDIQGTMVINPSSLAKGRSGGTFAEITIHTLLEKDLQEETLDSTHIGDRTSVRIIKI
jgi:DNA polymerase alpha subunit B